MLFALQPIEQAREFQEAKLGSYKDREATLAHVPVPLSVDDAWNHWIVPGKASSLLKPKPGPLQACKAVVSIRPRRAGRTLGHGK